MLRGCQEPARTLRAQKPPQQGASANTPQCNRSTSTRFAAAAIATWGAAFVVAVNAADVTAAYGATDVVATGAAAAPARDDLPENGVHVELLSAACNKGLYGSAAPLEPSLCAAAASAAEGSTALGAILLQRSGKLR